MKSDFLLTAANPYMMGNTIRIQSTPVRQTSFITPEKGKPTVNLESTAERPLRFKKPQNPNSGSKHTLS